ncbi:cyclic di-GMP phosphodiesterase [Obesumbacterium proteus]|uniref:cyclic di-GMP phosphodiesterase n=1 Tax=Obesumbacterium proteus TaxID=82983 RepID=UPI00103474E4|nr:cyclic di-GMP phosphodiesterase [Obesumbacterium proteus]TBL73509.1 cyclic di-GMP phosphodiesterase [Obesumbacterium proteus]
MVLPSALYRKPVSTSLRILISTLIAALVGILFVILAGHAIQNHRQSQQYELAKTGLMYATHLADDLDQKMVSLLPLTALDCESVVNTLASKAVFSGGVRAYILVRDGIAVCSSVTHSMSSPASKIYPKIDLNRDSDMVLQQGTPLVPDRPVIAFWHSIGDGTRTGVLLTLDINPAPYMLFFSRERTISGLALTIKDRAISTFEPKIVAESALPAHPDIIMQDEKNRFTFRLYGSPLSAGDLGLLGLITLLVAMVAWLITFYVLSQQRRLDRDILQGIKRGQFFLVYQPVIHSETQLPGGFEALVRWKHPKLGLVPPDEFIPYCESEGLIVRLTQHIMELAAQDAHRLIDVVPKGTKLGLNISPLHMTLDSFKTDVRHFLELMPTEHFVPLFEITERSMVQDGGAEKIFDWLHASGIELAIDDFGTGHSALIYLQRYKIDYLKIDRGFVNSIGLETVTAPVLDAVLELAQKLKLQIVAEGIETEEQAEYLRQRHVDYLQGYLFCRPMPLEQLRDYYQLHVNGKSA